MKRFALLAMLTVGLCATVVGSATDANAQQGCGRGYAPRGQYYRDPLYHSGPGTVRIEFSGRYRPSNVSPYQSSFYHPHPRGFYYGYGNDDFGYGVFPPTYTAPPPRNYPRGYRGVYGF